MLLVGFLLDSFFNPEDGSSTFLGNVCQLSPDYAALRHRFEDFKSNEPYVRNRMHNLRGGVQRDELLDKFFDAT